jgi:hypothetical protein
MELKEGALCSFFYLLIESFKTIFNLKAKPLIALCVDIKRSI